MRMSSNRERFISFMVGAAVGLAALLPFREHEVKAYRYATVEDVLLVEGDYVEFTAVYLRNACTHLRTVMQGYREGVIDNLSFTMFGLPIEEAKERLPLAEGWQHVRVRIDMKGVVYDNVAIITTFECGGVVVSDVFGVVETHTYTDDPEP